MNIETTLINLGHDIECNLKLDGDHIVVDIEGYEQFRLNHKQARKLSHIFDEVSAMFRYFETKKREPMNIKDAEAKYQELVRQEVEMIVGMLLDRLLEHNHNNTLSEINFTRICDIIRKIKGY